MNSPEKMFSTIRESGNNWKEREQNMLERLGREIDMVRELKNITNRIRVADSNGEVINKLNELREKFRAKFSVETLTNLDHIYLLLTEIGNIIDKHELNGESSAQELSDYEKLNAELKNAYADDDTYFLYNLEGIIEDLSKKHREVKEYKEQEEKGSQNKLILDLKQSHQLEDIDSNTLKLKIKWVIFEPFSVNVILESEFYDEVMGSETSSGRHIRGSTINLIRDNSSEIEKENTIKHEDYHSLLDGAASLFNIVPSVSLASFNYLQLPPFIAQQTKERILKLKAPELLNRLHQEMLVALDSENLKEFYDFVGFSSLEPGLFKKVPKLLIKMSTAGYEAGNVVEILLKQSKENPDEEMRKFCHNLCHRFSFLFTKTMAQYGLGREVASEIGEEAWEDVEILTHILKPIQFHHIFKFLIQKYGKEKVNEAVEKSRAFIETKEKTKITNKKLFDLIFGEQ